MTPFLARLVERAAPAPPGSAVARPVVPPLFAAGAMLVAGATAEAEARGDVTSGADGPASPALAARTPGRPADEVDRAPTWTPAVRHPPVEWPPAERQGSAPRTPAAAEREPAPARATARLPEMLALSEDGRSPEPRTPVATDGDGPAARMRAAPRAAPVAPAPRPAPPYRSQAAEPAPIVRVTIGRIEVRAVTGPAPAAPRPPVPPARRTGIVLEDYLRSGSVRP
jgi:hypothetical protein